MIRLKQEVDRASEMRNQALGFKGALRYVTPGTNQKSGRRKKRYLSALTEGPVDLSEPPRTGRLRDAPLRRNVTITEGPCTRNKGTARKARVQPFLDGCCTNNAQP